MGTGEMSGQLDKNAGGFTCDGLVSHPGGAVAILLVTSYATETEAPALISHLAPRIHWIATDLHCLYICTVSPRACTVIMYVRELGGQVMTDILFCVLDL